MKTKDGVKYKHARLLFLLSLFLLNIAAFIFGPLFFNNLAAAATTTSNTTKIPNVTQPEKPPITLGMSTALSGSAAPSGQGVKSGVETYFNKVNAAGGIQGRKIKLIVLDDGYEPIPAGQNVRQLIDKNQVLALIGNVGSPNAAVTVPITNEKKTLLFGARTGTSILRKTPPDRYVINFRASYADEAEAMIKGLLAARIKPDEIAFFTQNDAFGDSVYNGAIKALKAMGYSNPETLPHGRYDRNTENVIGALSYIIEEAKKPLKAIIIGGEYTANAKFIHLTEKEFPNAIFLIVSALIKTNDLNKEDDDKVIVTQVTPPLNSNLPAVLDYHEDLKKYNAGAQPGYASLEGYLTAKLFVMGLQEAATKNKLTREGIIDVFEKMRDVDIGIDAKISFDKNKHTALHQVWVSIFENEKFVSMDWSELGSKLRH